MQGIYSHKNITKDVCTYITYPLHRLIISRLYTVQPPPHILKKGLLYGTSQKDGQVYLLDFTSCLVNKACLLNTRLYVHIHIQ